MIPNLVFSWARMYWPLYSCYMYMYWPLYSCYRYMYV